MGMKWTFLFFALLLVGCESTGFNRGPSDFGRSSQGPPNLSFLPRSIHNHQGATSEKMPLTEVSNDARFSSKGLKGAELAELPLSVKPFPTVFFPFDSWEINPEVHDRLDATAKWMNQYPKYALRIEGHTDVRGTQSYNMILGARRAHAVKQYLAYLGIPSKRLETVSFGKELAVCDVDDESKCHQYNRRAELLVE